MYTNKKTVLLEEVGEVIVEASPKYQLNKTDWWKAIRGLGIILLASLITAVAAVYTEIDYTVCGSADRCVNFTPFVVPFVATLIELGRRFVGDRATAKVAAE